MVLEATTADPRNFSNAPWPGGSPPDSHWPPVPPAVGLRRVDVEGTEQFELLERISYAAHLPGRDVVVTVPQADGRFTTDLTSVPGWFTWLVPKSGAHLPAALVHDGLVLDRPAPGEEPVQTYETDDGEPIDRIDADRIFRDAMRDTHVGLVRRWVVWSAVTLASLVLGPRPRARWPLAVAVYYWAVMAVTLLGILYLGACATADLFEWRAALLWDLPWMHGHWTLRAVGGLAGAVVIPGAFALLTWGRYWPAGAIASVALATLVHVTLAVALVAGAYQLAELVLRHPRWAPRWVAAAVAVAVGVFVWRVA